MAKRIKKSLCLLLTVTMVATLFIGCGSSDNTTNKPKQQLQAMDDKTPMELSYAYWEDKYVVESLAKGWEEKHPNAKIVDPVGSMTTTDTHNDLIINAAASNTVPDVFWVLGTPEQFIKKGLLYDMRGMWKNDADAKNVVGGINEFGLGEFGTAGKWTTPVKFFPSVMFLNLTTFNKLGEAMPSADWTWEEFESKTKALSKEYQGEQYYGISEAITVITFYPIASDPDCTGEFGWDGKAFDLTNWADGLELEAEWRKDEVKAPNLDDIVMVETGKTGRETIVEKYGSEFWLQDRGYAAIRTDNWWCWERFWTTESFYQWDTFFVPYVMPHTEDNAESTNMFATIDFGGISSFTQHPLEAYYLLKWMTWGTEGWDWKLTHRDEIRERAISENQAAAEANTEEGATASTDVNATGGEVLNNCPITMDKDIWARYEAFHPNPDTPDPIADRLEKAGLSKTARSDVFPGFWEKVKAGKWACYGSQQIPGFDTVLVNTYQKGDFNGQVGVEDAVFAGASAEDFVTQLTDAFNEEAQSYMDELNSQIQNQGK